MTVIVLREGIMAADRLMSYAGNKMAPGCKLIVGETDHYWFVSALAGTAQSSKAETELAVLTMNTQEPQKMTAPYELLVFGINKVTRRKTLINVEQEPNGDLSATTYQEGEDWPEYFTIGSGMDMALGALAHGASAVQAVIAVNKHSQKCGEGYNWASFEEPRGGFVIRRRG